MTKLAVGETIGHYRILKFLGRGGFSLVYLAEHEDHGEKVALKIGRQNGGSRHATTFVEITARRSPEGMSPDETPAQAVFMSPSGWRVDLLDVSEIDALLDEEAKILARVDSPHLVRLKERFLVGGRPVLAMEYIRGKTLREKIRALEGIHLNWFLAIVRALILMKSAGELDHHGDLKPENILVKPSGKVMLVDPSCRLPDREALTLTPYYNPLLLTDSKADVMGIGIMIYEILTGTLPFDDAPWRYAGRRAHGETERLSLSYYFSYMPPRMLNAKTPQDLERIIYRCITTMEYGLPELCSDLEEFIKKA
jgi:serine/threonine protein kinase